MEEEGRYIYCIGEKALVADYGPMGIGGQNAEAYAVTEGELAAVISRSPVVKHPISRANTMAHQLVMEKAMRYGTILPVRFGTIAEVRDGLGPEELIRAKLLTARCEEFTELLDSMRGKVELGLKVLWTDMARTFDEIRTGNAEVRQLKARIQRGSSVSRNATIGLGEMVKKALEAKREREARMLLRPLKKLAAEFRGNKVSGDSMIANGAFLVAEDRVEEFDRIVNELSERCRERIRLRYVGPIPPCNFVEVVVTWD